MSPNLLCNRSGCPNRSCDDAEYCGEGSRGVRVCFVWNSGFDLDGVCAFVGEYVGVVFGGYAKRCVGGFLI